MYYIIFVAVIILAMGYSHFFTESKPKLSGTKDLCVLALLTALTVLLAVYGTIRVGAGIKVSFKFISVFMTAVLFGPLWGGAVGALADVIAFVINPVGGVFLPQITMIEFLHGFVYGLFFFGANRWCGLSTVIRIVLCVLIQTLLLTFALTTYFLMPLMQMSYGALLAMRSVSVLVSMSAQIVVLLFLNKYMSALRKAVG